MHQLALVALLLGAPFTGGPEGDKPSAAPATTNAAEESIINDTFSFGSDTETPIKFWVSYGIGVVDEVFEADGDATELRSGGVFQGELTSRRLLVGTQINLLNLRTLKFGVGGQLNLAGATFVFQDDPINGSPDPLTPFYPLLNGGAGEVETSLGLQGVKVFGTLEGKVLGVHGGYLFDLGPEREFGTPITSVNGVALPTPIPDPQNAATTDEQDAWFIGTTFDYPSKHIRLHGGFDYFRILEGETNNPFAALPGQPATVTLASNNDRLFFRMGLGVKFSIVEIGASATIQAQLERTAAGEINRTAVSDRQSGGHHGSISPYLNLSFGQVGITARGGVTSEYGDYSYALGGGNEPITRRGVTVGLTYGF